MVDCFTSNTIDISPILHQTRLWCLYFFIYYWSSHFCSILYIMEMSVVKYCNKRKNDFAHSDTRGEELLQKAKQLLRRKRGQKESSFSDTISNLDFKPPLSFNYGKTDPIKRFLLYLGRQVWSWFVLLYLCEAVDYIWHGIWFGYIVAVPKLYLLREISFLFRSRQSWWMSTIPY